MSSSNLVDNPKSFYEIVNENLISIFLQLCCDTQISLEGKRERLQSKDDAVMHLNSELLLRLEPKRGVDELNYTKISELVSNGADVQFFPEKSTPSALETALRIGDEKLLMAFLSTTRALDFTIRCSDGEPLLHLICEHIKENVISALTHQIICRIVCHLEDNIDFSIQNSSGMTLLTYAASLGCLHHIFEPMWSLSFVQDRLDPFYLPMMWSFDRRRISTSHSNLEEYFDYEMPLAEGNESTAALLRLCRITNWCLSIPELKDLITMDPDVNFYHPQISTPILQRCFSCASFEALEILMKTQHPIDFTATDSELGRALIFYLCDCSVDDSNRLLDLVIQRLKERVDDKIDWLQRDRNRLSFFSYAAHRQKLSLVWNKIKSASIHPTSHEIRLTMKVHRWDWNALGEESKNFIVVRGFIE